MEKTSPNYVFLNEEASRLRDTEKSSQQVPPLEIAWMALLAFFVFLAAFPTPVVMSENSGIPGVNAPRQESSYYKRRNHRDEVPNTPQQTRVPLQMGKVGTVAKVQPGSESRAERIQKVCEWQKQQGRPLGSYCKTPADAQQQMESPKPQRKSRQYAERDVWANDHMEQLFMGGGKDPWSDEMFLTPEQRQRREEERQVMQQEQAEEAAFKRRMQELTFKERQQQMALQKEDIRQKKIDAEQQRKLAEEDLALRKEEQSMRSFTEILGAATSLGRTLSGP